MGIWNSIFECLQDVLKGQCKYVVLQRTVDRLIIDDKIPEDFSDEQCELLSELQAELELIAEHQSSHLSLSSSYGEAEIVALLEGFAVQMVEIGVEDKSSRQCPPTSESSEIPFECWKAP